jgi:AraC-like DNA-binding protein
MADPLAEIVTLLQPRLNGSKLVLATNPWNVSGKDSGETFYCVVLEGACFVVTDDHAPLEIRSGDFVLIPQTFGFSTASDKSLLQLGSNAPPTAIGNSTFRVGAIEGPVDTRLLVGHCSFGSPDAALLVSLLPRLVHIRGDERLATLMQLLRDEATQERPAREVVLQRLLEVLFIETLRSADSRHESAGLLRGLADSRLASAIRHMHEDPAHGWTVAELAKASALSRSTFFERFNRAIGISPMEYLLSWRMALARDLLRRNAGNVAEIAARVGYRSASTFSVAFTRHVGLPPSHYARQRLATVPA